MSMTTDMLFTACLADLEHFEGTRLFVYDDATGLPIGPGSHVIGHPTIGTGRTLDLAGISAFEARTLLNTDVHGYLMELALTFPWFVSLDMTRQRVLVAMRHQLGFRGLLQFHVMLTAIADHDFKTAATAGRNSRWYDQTPDRADQLMNAMLTGLLLDA